MGVDVAGSDASPALHGNGCREALSPGGGAAVQHPDILPGQLGAQDGELGGRVLNIEAAFPEGGQLLNAAGAGEDQTVFHPSMGLSLNLLRGQPFDKFRRTNAQGVDLHHRLRCGVVGNQGGLQRSLGKVGLQKGNQWVRMAVAVGIGNRLYQLSPGPRRAAQDAVDQGGRLWVFAIFLRQGHGFVYRGAVGNFVQFIDLIQPQVKNVPHHRVQVLQPSRQELLQIKVQLVPVLQDAVAQPGGQGCVPAVQAVPADILLQHAVGPGPAFAAGHQRVQRRFPGPH